LARESIGATALGINTASTRLASAHETGQGNPSGNLL
jgi:hypothetical protein